MAQQHSGQEHHSKKVNINKASIEELETLKMIGRRRAEDLVKYRNEHGPFKSCEDLKDVPGFSEKMIHDLEAEGLTCR